MPARPLHVWRFFVRLFQIAAVAWIVLLVHDGRLLRDVLVVVAIACALLAIVIIETCTTEPGSTRSRRSAMLRRR